MKAYTIQLVDIPVGRGVIPLKIHREVRSNCRIAMGHKSVNLRLPIGCQTIAGQDPLEFAAAWIAQQYCANPQGFVRYQMAEPYDGKVYQTVFGDYTLKISRMRAGNAARGITSGTDLLAYCPDNWSQEDRCKFLPTLVSRLLVSALYLPFLQRVVALNRQHFGFRLGDISLKYNKSNWGSCSSSGNLNFSSRLLLTVPQACDYVIIHELAHLQELNHSPAFYQLIASAMPDYRTWEVWLKKEGSSLFF